MKRFDFKAVKPVVKMIVKGKPVLSERVRDTHEYGETVAEAKDKLKAKGYINIKVNKKVEDK